jgi:protein subunit release factor A
VLDTVPSDLGGIKDTTFVVRGAGAEGVWASMKFEGGVHRVQRVPVTESQGRIHTSAAGVLVYPDTGEDAAVRSTRRTCASTCSAPRATAGRASTPPTPPSGSRTCPPASS